MREGDWQAEQFEEHRAHLRAVAYRMLGSMTGADDAVQDAWLRFNRADTARVENLGGWLTTVVARVCLNMLRARKSHREQSSASTSGTGRVRAWATTQALLVSSVASSSGVGASLRP
jgi:RNA polymerase sigma-70 factor (ECF subfamily)